MIIKFSCSDVFIKLSAVKRGSSLIMIILSNNNKWHWHCCFIQTQSGPSALHLSCARGIIVWSRSMPEIKSVTSYMTVLMDMDKYTVLLYLPDWVCWVAFHSKTPGCPCSPAYLKIHTRNILPCKYHHWKTMNRLIVINVRFSSVNDEFKRYWQGLEVCNYVWFCTVPCDHVWPWSMSDQMRNILHITLTCLTWYCIW